jgi:predicted dehydrogenase
MKSKRINLIEIGFGPHAKRVYSPALEELKSKFNVNLCLVVDLKEKEEDIRSYFKRSKNSPEFFFVDMFQEQLPEDIEKYLTDYIKKNNISAVIISTEPLTHYIYAKWALKNGLHILMDKPISTNKDVISNINQAKKVEEDYLDLLHLYNELQRSKDTAFVINAQRRFHSGYKTVVELLTEIAKETNCPVTSIQSMHCDGQWRLPNEIVSQDYHPYNSGYGKASHSGYHIFDTVCQFYRVSKFTNKVADGMEVYSSMFQPNGFLKQINETDYEKYFGNSYSEVKKYSDKELSEVFPTYGEIDLSSVIRLLKDGVCMGNISINLLHNGFGMRNWILPAKDLYKGNGRVKHEYHNIQQGPFQNIQIHSYQSKDKHDVNTIEDDELGGNNHFDIYVFRNERMLGHGKPLEVIRMSDLKKKLNIEGNDKLVVEQVKHKVVEEFLSFITGTIKKEDLTSNIEDHLMPVQIMSSMYQSHNKYLNKENPLVHYGIQI